MKLAVRRRPRARRRGWMMEPVTGRRLADPRATIAVLVYRGVTTVEVDTPVRRLADRLGADVVLVGAQRGPVPGVEPARLVVADSVPADGTRFDVLVVPGGLGWGRVAEDASVMRWVADAALTARGILAISTGSLLLASAGVLDGREATGHWLAEDDLSRLGAQVRSARVAHADAGRLVTASGAMAALGVVDALADHVSWSRR